MPDPASPPPEAPPLPPEELERLARWVHEQWMQGRLAEGWTRGPRRDEAARTMPGLVPYDALPESEKEYDRATVRAALGGLRELGYRLVREKEAQAPGPADDSPEGELPALFRQWRQHDTASWSRQVERYVDLATRALERGHPLLAYEVVSEGLEARPGHLRMRQLQALALARSGATERANHLLREILEEDAHRAPQELEETLGMLARTHKDLALQAATPQEVGEHLRHAFELYHRAFVRTGGTYTGINAATLALLLGRGEESRRLAAAVQARLPAQPEEADYYQAASHAEAALLLGDRAGAEVWYRRAAAAGGSRYGDLASTRRNARMILSALEWELPVDELLPLPQVGVLISAGSAALEEEDGRRVAAQIREWIARRRIAFGYASAGADPELLFLEAVREQGGETHIVLPGDPELHRRELASGGTRAERFERALAEAWEVCAATDEHTAGDGTFRSYAEKLRIGLARMHAMGLDGDAHALVLYPEDAVPATVAALLRTAPWPPRETDVLPLPAAAAREAPHTETADEAFIAGILFADVYRYSRLTDEQIPRFVRNFFGLVARVARVPEHAPVFQNTWGDGLYFVFRDVREAGRCALALTREIAATDWEALGLRGDLALRIGLHAGPVFRYPNPVTGNEEFTSKHTIRAARIEPVTPPGAVYASREFAALAAADDVREFACEPVGRIALAKRAATVPLFVLRQRAPGLPR